MTDKLIDEEAERLYQPSKWSLRFPTSEEVLDNHMKIIREESESSRTEVLCELNVAYGLKPRQKVDIYGAYRLPPDAPVLVLIHGGYWQMLGKDEWALGVRSFFRHGIVTIVPDYTLAPKATMDEIVEEIRAAGRFIKNWMTLRGSTHLHLLGHSAGAHLLAMLLASECFQIPCHAWHLSGVFDLRPLLRTTVNSPLNMDMSCAERNSPLLHVQGMVKHNPSTIHHVIVAENDSPSFREQSLEFYHALKKTEAVETDFSLLPQLDHFDIVENFQHEDFCLTQQIIQKTATRK
ncbi:unnamed protein product [Darwinula stevensoni]|uniref:BD-FAE-like domain-containing protein n=1 Tax=Darwinula stevensoni TaxID=69355 RepID=A0A7R8X5T3_9CRUS|nr:unnamed protein product [Darwinula stevensoni]CAG0881287.1 unnamed protein product [Darwinula stevensoni]